MAEAPRPTTVWFDNDRSRYFAIPEDVDVLPGGFFLRSSRGGHRTVDPDAVATYEVPKDEAVRLMKEELEQTVRRVGSSITDLLQGSKGEGARADGERIVRGLGRVFGSALNAISETLTNPATAEEVKTRTEQLREGVEKEAEKVEPAVQALGGKIKEILASPEVSSAIDTLGKGLQDIARQVKRPAPGEPEPSAAQRPEPGLDPVQDPLHPQEDDGDHQQGQEGAADHAADDGDGHGGAKL